MADPRLEWGENMRHKAPVILAQGLLTCQKYSTHTYSSGGIFSRKTGLDSSYSAGFAYVSR